MRRSTFTGNWAGLCGIRPAEICSIASTMKAMIKMFHLEDLLAVAAVLSIVVAPFLWQEVKLALLSAWFLARALRCGSIFSVRRILALTAMALVAAHGLFFVIIGIISGALPDTLKYTVPLYVVFPLFFGALSLVVERKDLDALFGILVLATPFLSLYLILYFLSQIGLITAPVPSFYDVSRVSLVDGHAGISHHSVSSLLFMAPLYISYGLVMKRGRTTGIIYLIGFILLFLAIFTSNRRSILVISGLACVLVVAYSVFVRNGVVSLRTVLSRLVLALMVTVFTVESYSAYTDINIDIYLSNVVNTVNKGISDSESDEERVYQKDALLDSFFENVGFGKGHGVPIWLIRDEDKPWRYEMSFYANLHREGLIGFSIYVLLLLGIYAMPLWGMGVGRFSEIDLCLYIASLTQVAGYFVNPTLDSFDSYWQLVLPVWLFVV